MDDESSLFEELGKEIQIAADKEIVTILL